MTESTPQVRKLTKNLGAAVRKNGGTGFGYMLYGSPNPRRDDAEKFSDKFEFSLHESYPDRIVNIADFEFDPKTNRLIKVNIIEPGKPTILAYNKRLLADFKKACR
jgi:hypothetical protein